MRLYLQIVSEYFFYSESVSRCTIDIRGIFLFSYVSVTSIVVVRRLRSNFPTLFASSAIATSLRRNAPSSPQKVAKVTPRIARLRSPTSFSLFFFLIRIVPFHLVFNALYFITFIICPLRINNVKLTLYARVPLFTTCTSSTA